MKQPTDSLRSFLTRHGVSRPWVVYWEAVFGMTDEWDDEDRAIFSASTNLVEPRPGGYATAYCAVGRRGSKSWTGAAVAAWWMTRERALVERALGAGNVTVVQQDARAGEGVFVPYVLNFLEQDGALADATADVLEATSGATLRALPCSPRAVRGWKSGLVLLDEWDHFLNSDLRSLSEAVLRAARPTLFGIRTGRIVMLSSPAGIGGALHRAFERHYGRPGGSLFWRASALTMRPDLLGDPQMAALRDDDPRGFDQEVLAEFTSATGSLLDVDALKACVREDTGTPRQPGTVYYARLDIGGSRDGSGFALGHRLVKRETDSSGAAWDAYVAHIDLVAHQAAPHRPEDFIRTTVVPKCREYGVSKVSIDAGKTDLVRVILAEGGITVDWTTKTSTSDFHLAFEGFLTSGRVSLPKHETTLRELRGLRRLPGGQVTHGSGHDDAAAAVTALTSLLYGGRVRRPGDVGITFADDGESLLASIVNRVGNWWGREDRERPEGLHPEHPGGDAGPGWEPLPAPRPWWEVEADKADPFGENEDDLVNQPVTRSWLRGE